MSRITSSRIIAPVAQPPTPKPAAQPAYHYETDDIKHNVAYYMNKCLTDPYPHWHWSTNLEFWTHIYYREYYECP